MNTEYTALLEKIEAELTRSLPEKPNELWVQAQFGKLECAPSASILNTLNIPAIDLVSRGGKRWRPALMVILEKLSAGTERSLALAPIPELAHNASLILDDIEDSSDMRRGKPCVHHLYGSDVAINAGCLLYFSPLALLDSWDGSDAEKLRIHSLYAKRMRCLHLGQAMDISWHREPDELPSIEQYLLMTRMKTGVLARFSAELGLICANEKPDLIERASTAVENLGVAFQILDDVKNLTDGNPGKNRGDDIVEGKKSLPYLLACENSQDNFLTLSAYVKEAKRIGIEAKEVELAITIIREAGALEKARQLAITMLSESAYTLEEIYSLKKGYSLLSSLLEAIH